MTRYENATPPDAPPLLHTPEEVADILRTSRDVVYEMNRKHKIPGALRIGRRLLFRRDHLLRWLRESSVASPSEDR